MERLGRPSQGVVLGSQVLVRSETDRTTETVLGWDPALSVVCTLRATKVSPPRTGELQATPQAFREPDGSLRTKQTPRKFLQRNIPRRRTAADS